MRHTKGANMKFAISAVALCGVLGGTGTAMADHHDSKLAIGVARTAFVQGIDIRLGLTDDIGLEALAGFNFLSTTDPATDESSTATAIAIGARALYGLWDFGSRARVFGFGGLAIATATDQDTLIGIEGGLKIEWFPVPYASLSVDMGAAIGINDSPDSTDPMAGSVTVIDIGNGGLAGGASWNFWW